MRFKNPITILQLTSCSDGSTWPHFDREAFNRLPLERQQAIIEGLRGVANELAKQQRENAKKT